MTARLIWRTIRETQWRKVRWVDVRLTYRLWRVLYAFRAWRRDGYPGRIL